jgi:hypothetical protein
MIAIQDVKYAEKEKAASFQYLACRFLEARKFDFEMAAEMSLAQVQF